MIIQCQYEQEKRTEKQITRNDLSLCITTAALCHVICHSRNFITMPSRTYRNIRLFAWHGMWYRQWVIYSTFIARKQFENLYSPTIYCLYDNILLRYRLSMHLWSSGLFYGWLDGLKLSPGQFTWSLLHKNNWAVRIEKPAAWPDQFGQWNDRSSRLIAALWR